ncbi:hypothetical protein F2Q70_00037367 [Brassica cretica]|uniref:Uncharacterized protein n=1 Tax=Brassica cretica TaxID=69181 RepID=A0A8S9JW89_BRACR|nr:hypothetical protein F2Q70_00037367 [Brassica cretica]
MKSLCTTSRSDRTKSLAFSRPETHRFDPGATSQSDVLKSLPMFRATCWSDTPRSLVSSRPETPKSSILERPLRAIYQGRSQPELPARAPIARVLTGRDTKKRVGSDLLGATMLILEYHMEFLETFGCVWSSKEVIKVIIGRAMHGSDLPERRHELARH